MRTIILAAMSLVAFNGQCQTPAKETETLQSLLVEVHQLRQDIEAITLASQRVQIALYGLQIQDAAVARAAQRLDDARNRRLGAEAGREHTASQLQMMESSLASGKLPESETKEVQSRLPQLKSELDAQTSEVQNRQAVEAEAGSEFRTQQVKLSELQERIDRLDKALEKMGDGGKRQ